MYSSGSSELPPRSHNHSVMLKSYKLRRKKFVFMKYKVPFSVPCLHWHLPVVAPRPRVDSQSVRCLFSAQDRTCWLFWPALIATTAKPKEHITKSLKDTRDRGNMLENSLHVCLLWSSTYLCHLFWCGSECSPPAVRFPPEQQQGTASPGTRVCAVPQSHSHTDVPTSSLGIGWCLWLCSRPVSQQTCSYLAPQVGIWHWSHRTAGSFPHRFCQPDRSWDKRLKTWMTLENTSVRME